MQALNSQRKAFLDMVAWSEGTDNGRQPTRNHGYDVIVGGELFTDYQKTGSVLPNTSHTAGTASSVRQARPEFSVIGNNTNTSAGQRTYTGTTPVTPRVPTSTVREKSIKIPDFFKK